MAKKKSEKKLTKEEELLLGVQAVIEARRAERERQPHTLTVFDTNGDYICDVPFNEEDWRKLLEASVQMFVVEAIRQLVKKETGKDFG